MVMGWDMNLDGTIDIPVSTNSGFTTANIPLNQWHDIPNSTTTEKNARPSLSPLNSPEDRGQKIGRTAPSGMDAQGAQTLLTTSSC